MARTSGRVAVVAAAFTLLSVGSASATTIFSNLGNQDFTDGEAVTTGTFTGVSDVAPFNTFNGSDTVGPNMDLTWTHTITSLSGLTSGSILIGGYDFDGTATGDQVFLFTVGGVDLTAALNTLINAGAGASGSEYYYSVTLTPGVLSALSGQTSAVVHLTLQGPGSGILGDTTFNGGGVDFSWLTLSNDPVVPEPTASALVGSGLVAVLWVRRRLSR